MGILKCPREDGCCFHRDPVFRGIRFENITRGYNSCRYIVQPEIADEMPHLVKNDLRISERSEKRIAEIAARYPRLSKDIEDYYFRLSIMIKEEADYSSMKEKGLVFPNVYHKLLEKIEKERAGLEEHIFNIV